MSQLLIEAVHEVQRAAEIAAATTISVVQHPPGFDAPVVDLPIPTPLADFNISVTTEQNTTKNRRLYGALGQSKSWFMPALNSALNTSLSRSPREKDAISPPWAPASLFLHWDAVKKMVVPLLPQFVVHKNATVWNETVWNGTVWNMSEWNETVRNKTYAKHPLQLRCLQCNHSFATAPAHLQRARRRHSPPMLLQRRLLSTEIYNEAALLSTELYHDNGRRSLGPNSTAMATEIWNSPHFLNMNSTGQSSICAGDFAKRLEASTALRCADALALVLACTALFVCMLTLACIWMLTRRLNQEIETPEKLGTEGHRPVALMTATLVEGDSGESSPKSPLQRVFGLIPRPDRRFSALC